jgi:glycosyltransferase involved in cell wall biosynthesis
VRVCIISLSPIADDPRVRRQGDTLAAAGHEVSAAGSDGARSSPPSWPVRTLPVPPLSAAGRVATGLRLLSVRLSPRLAEQAFWSVPAHRRFVDLLADVHADVYHANDWPALPIAARLARQARTRFVYDTHEYATEEFSERLRWRTLMAPYVRVLEGRHIGDAAVISAVGKGIADLLRRDYGLPDRPFVIRNLPSYRGLPLRAPGTPIHVLYHGLYRPHRGLEQLIRSVPRWRAGLRLELRGLGPAGYEAELRQLARGLAVEDRVTFSPPVPPEHLVPLANHADIGVFAIPATTQQMRHCLPNKLFEYIMAGLAVCVTALPDMADVVHRYDVGRTLAEPTADGIAAVLNRWSRADILDCKRNALSAARELCWEREQGLLLDIYRNLAADEQLTGSAEVARWPPHDSHTRHLVGGESADT